MKTVKIIDKTLCEANTMRSNTITFKEKLELARSLDRLNVDVIELPPISGAKADQLANKTIASMVKTVLSAEVDVAEGNVEETWESIKEANQPRLTLNAPVSPVQMEYTNGMKAPAMLDAIKAQVEKCKAYCEHVEFAAIDATRAEPEFLYDAIAMAVGAGANKVTICDTAGVMLPAEFAAFIEGIQKNVDMTDVKLFVQVSDQMDMALACAAAVIEKGASGIKCTATPAGYPTIEKAVSFIETKSDAMQITTNVRTTELATIIDQMKELLRAKRGESRFGNVALDDISNITLDSNDEIADVIQVVKQLGYFLSEEDNVKVYDEFCRVAAEKKFVGTRELDAIVASTANQVPSTYHIDNFVITSGNVISSTANIQLERNGEKLRGVGVGDGPIDASFLAIEEIIGHHYELDDFQIKTVSEGYDAMGSALVKLRAGGNVYSGTGLSTDIIGASIRAYINALNKIVYEEK